MSFRHGVVTVVVRISAPGTVEVVATHGARGSFARSLVTLPPLHFIYARTTSHPTKAGLVRVTLRSTPGSRRQLSRLPKRDPHLALLIAYQPTGGPTVVTVKLHYVPTVRRSRQRPESTRAPRARTRGAAPSGRAGAAAASTAA